MKQRPIATTKAEIEAKTLRIPDGFPAELGPVAVNLRDTFVIAISSGILIFLLCVLRQEHGIWMIGSAAFGIITWRQCLSTRAMYRFLKPHFEFRFARRWMHAQYLLVSLAAMEFLISACGLIGLSLGWKAPLFG